MKIVLCEDELIIALDIKMILAQNGFDITGIFKSAEETLVFIKKEKPDLVISDIRLKGKMDGVVLAEKLIKKYSIKVLLISGEILTHYKEKVDELKLGYILKPISPVELLKKVNALLAGSNND